MLAPNSEVLHWYGLNVSSSVVHWKRNCWKFSPLETGELKEVTRPWGNALVDGLVPLSWEWVSGHRGGVLMKE